jgi:hypothetical protein
MSILSQDPELERRLKLAHENVKVAEAEVEVALRTVEKTERADKRIITAALRTAFEKLAIARSELEAILNA